MNGWHDLGGLQCFGPVPREADETQVFHEPWEGRVFGISLALPAQGVYNLNEFRAVREHLPPEVLLLGQYYDRWLGAIERLVEDKGVLEAPASSAGTGPAVGDGRAAGSPELAARLRDLVHRGVPSTRPAERPPRFAVGETVRARNVHPLGHTRLPRYARGHLGQVTAHRGNIVVPDASAAGEEGAEHLYTVRFAARELWGEAAPARDAVCLDLWERYLEPVPVPVAVAGAAPAEGPGDVPEEER